MSLDSDKNLGGIGAILLAIPALNLVGIILLLIAMKGLSEHYKENDIFQNALYGFIFGIIGFAALVGVIFLFAIVGVSVDEPITSPYVGFGLFIIIVVVWYVFGLIAAFFYKKALDLIAKKSAVSSFGTAGLLLLIGAFIPIVGAILSFVAWILAAVSFFSIKASTESAAAQPAATASEEKKFCSKCGAPNRVEATFCQKCGEKIV
ncbi:DUF996 domain-containing protein [Candidatus Bathyarchaeota archaeon]|nr:DUF996 domain-containing protein [Candidatus Bathyarchaeota archaeon]